MQFPDPRTAPCPDCGWPSVLAQTAIGAVRVHCGTWRYECDTDPVLDELAAWHARFDPSL